jgi:hypothetical protein
VRRVAAVPDPIHGGTASATTHEVTAPAEEVRPLITRANMVAGAAETAVGALLGWSGSGTVSRGRLLTALRAAGLPETWLPAAKSAHAQAAEAVERLNGIGYVARAERKGRRGTVGARRYVARWIVGRPHTSGAVGEDLGTIACTVTLWDGDTLECQGDDGLCARVRAAYDALASGDLYQAGDVTEWLRGVIRGRWGGVRLGGTWYVPRRYVTVAEALCRALAEGERWGLDWILPALPVTTSEGLKTGLVRGLIQEANQLVSDWRDAVQRAGGKIGERSASTVLKRLGEVTERARGYAAVLGPDHVRSVQSTLAALRAEVEPHVSEAAQRGALVWEELQP